MTGSESANQRKDPSKTTAAVWVPIILGALGAISGGAGWIFNVWSELHSDNDRAIKTYLRPMEIKIHVGERLFDQLGQLKEPNMGILQSYIFKKERNARDPNVELMNELIVDVIQNNAALDTLVDGYYPQVCTTEFHDQALAFEDYKTSYATRWGTASAYIEQNKQMPSSPSFPQKFSIALQGEITARQEHPGCDKSARRGS